MQVNWTQLNRAAVAFVHDVVMAAASFAISLALRIGPERAFERLGEPELQTALVVFTLVCAAVFLWLGLYRGIWRYASLNDVESIVKAVTLALLLFLPVTFMVTRLESVPRSFLLINWFVLLALLGGPRLLYQLLRYRSPVHLLERDTHLRVPVLLIGAGDPAETFIREMARQRQSAYEVLGVIDDKGGRVGRQIHDIPVLCHLDVLPQKLERIVQRTGRRPQRMILTKDLDRDRLSRLLAFAEREGLTLARLPQLTDFRSEAASALAPKPIAIEDLLRRPQIWLDDSPPRQLVAGRRVLVTGAGGSIGAELVRQLAAFEPDEITLLDSSEYLLYAIDLELSEARPALRRRAVLGDVRDAATLERVMAAARPAVVFHAAALKHVPLIELNPEEAVSTNVVGTRRVAEACRRHGVEVMVLISTDKAVDPSSVMGATKRLAESYCQALDLARVRGGDRGTRFVTVRFGNVLGSTGSVVPLFQRQLARGGPLTVTHPDMRRYFMTIREAVRLVLQAAALGAEAPLPEAGKIHVLDMGEPIRILELAEQIIRLAGKRPYKDVEILFTGLRPGERLEEQLFHDGEEMAPTAQPGLLLAAPRTSDIELLERGLDELAELARRRGREDLRALLHRLVPEFEATAATEKGGDKTAAVS